MIYVVKNKLFFLIGLGNGYNMVCLDVMVMICEISEYMEIYDKEFVIVKKDSVEV